MPAGVISSPISPFTLAAVTASTHGTGPVADCSGWASLAAMCSITTGTPTAASITAFRVWLQGQMNPGGVWNDLPFLWVTKTFNSVAAGLNVTAGVTTANSAVLVNEGGVTSAAGFSYYGRLNCPPPSVRVAYVIVTVSGSPSITFGVEGLLTQIAGP